MRLTWGSLDLTDSPYLVEFGFDPGAPQNESVSLPFLLQDGEIELSSRAGNRALTFTVIIEGADLAEMSDAEAALIFESERVLNTIEVDPEDFGPVAVYEVFRGQVSMARDDNQEMARLRRYNVTVRAYPFVRSATETVTAALPATGSTTTSLDACSATTGWTGFIDNGSVSPSTAGGSVLVTGTVTAGLHTFSLQKTFAATTTSTKFLAVDWLRPAGATTDDKGAPGLAATGDGVALPLLAEIPSTTSGYVRSYFNVAASSLAVTRFDYTARIPAGSKSFAITQVDVTNVNPIIGTGRQQARSLAVSGSARTQGALAIESETAALGDGTLVYVYPRDETTNGYSPSLRQFRLSGSTVTPNAALVSGASEPLGGGSGPTVFAVPIGLFPRGSYVLMGRLATSGGGTVTMGHGYATKYGSTSLDLTTVSGGTHTTTTAYQTFALARIQLPSVDLDAAAATAGAVMYLTANAVSGACTYDDFWLFNTSIGQLTWVDCGTGAGAVGGSSRRLFLEPATTTTPRPTLRVGHSADRSDSHYPLHLVGTTVFDVRAWQSPEFKPPQVNVFTVTPNATDATVTLRHYERSHTNPAS